MDTKVTQAKSILTKTKLPDSDYVVNPYTGCSYGCTYCYASFMGRFVNKTVNDWGNYVYAKENAPELLAKEIIKIPNKGRGKTLFFSSVTDPYQGIEAKYKLTRKCLEILADYGFEGKVSFLTKSNLITRDLDVIKQLRNPDIGMTITSTDDDISRYFEKFAPSSSIRLKTLKQINDAGIPTYAFVGPLLPHFVAEERNLDDLFKKISDTGTKELYIEHINLKGYILERLKSEMKDVDKGVLKKFYDSQNKNYRDDLNKILEKLVKKYKFKLRLGSTLFHPNLEKK